MHIRLYIFPALFMLLLSACAGFEPLYAENTAVRRGFTQLSAAPIDGRAGFLFSQALNERGGIQNGLSGTYVLESQISKKQINVGVRIDNVSTRARLQMDVRYNVRDRDGKIVYQGRAQSSAAFDVPDQPYGALIAERSAEENATTILAEKVINDLAVFFASISD